MGESAATIFAKIAIEKGLLDEKKLEQARTLQRLARKDGKAVTIDKACLELELLTAVQVKGLERGLKYYIVRKADKIYGKLAVQKKFADKDTVEHCLERQKTEFQKKRLVRLSKLLMGLDAISKEQDDEIRALVLKRLSPEESHHEAEAISEDEIAEITEKTPAPKGARGKGAAAKSAAKTESGEKPARSEKTESGEKKKAFIVAPKNGSGRSSGERKAASESGRAAAGGDGAAVSGRKNIEVRKASASGRAGAKDEAAKKEDAAKKDESARTIPPRPVRPSKERKAAASISSEDDLESAPVLELLAPDGASDGKRPASDETEKLAAQPSGEPTLTEASDDAPALPVPSPISASDTTETGPRPVPLAIDDVASPAPASKAPAISEEPLRVHGIDSKDEEFLLDDEVEVPAAGVVKPALEPAKSGPSEDVDWALPAVIGDTAEGTPACDAGDAVPALAAGETEGKDEKAVV